MSDVGADNSDSADVGDSAGLKDSKADVGDSAGLKDSKADVGDSAGLEVCKGDVGPYEGDDKLGHFLAGGVLAGGIAFVLKRYVGVWLAVLIATVVTVAVLFGKEVWDSLGNGCADVWDLWCGLVGLLVAVAVFLLFFAYKKGRRV